MVSPRLVDASCEVGDGLCRDILCLIQWVGVRHCLVQGIVQEQKGGEVISYCRTPSSDEHNLCGKGRPPFARGVYVEGRVAGRRRESQILGYGSHPCDDE
jgi:hypothetical protein